MLNLTRMDHDDFLEGIKKRPEKKWKQSKPLTPDEKLQDELVKYGGSVDVKALAKKYGKTSSEILQLMSDLGLC